MLKHLADDDLNGLEGTVKKVYDDGKCALAWAIYKNGKPLLTRCAGDELTFNDAQTADIYSITPKPGDRFKAWLQVRTRPAGSRAPQPRANPHLSDYPASRTQRAAPARTAEGARKEGYRIPRVNSGSAGSSYAAGTVCMHK